MKRFWIVALVMSLLFIGAQFAMAAGNFYIPGSRDKEGGIGEDGKSFKDGFINSLGFEGPTSNAFETYLSATDPTADNAILLPDSSGTLSLTSGEFAGALADGKILIGNNTGGGVAVAVTPSGAWTITNAGVASQGASTILSSNIAIANVATSDLADSAVTSAKIAIANVTATDLFINTVTATIAAGTTGATLNVEAGSILVGTNLVSGISNVFTLNRSTFAGGVWDINTAAHTGSMIINGIFIRP